MFYEVLSQHLGVFPAGYKEGLSDTFGDTNVAQPGQCHLAAHTRAS